MATNAYPDLHAEFPFAALLRATDRERLLVQLMASVWAQYTRAADPGLRQRPGGRAGAIRPAAAGGPPFEWRVVGKAWC